MIQVGDALRCELPAWPYGRFRAKREQHKTFREFCLKAKAMICLKCAELARPTLNELMIQVGDALRCELPAWLCGATATFRTQTPSHEADV